MNKKHKKIGLFGLILGSIIKLLFFTKKKPKTQKNIYKTEYNRQTSNQEYVEVDATDKQPDFNHPNKRYIHPNNRNDDDVIRSPDGSA
tara:strand:+ start:426 stop:689 length:264 start_codon:yes stop_codon:yes gene_type:complete